MEEDPYKSPNDADTSLESSLGEGEEILFQIAARSRTKRSWFFGLWDDVIGKFIVTNRRVMFLSSGKIGSFGITQESMERRIAESVDFTAMSRESSWEFELSKLRSADESKPKPSVLPTQSYLQLAGTDRYGREVGHKVYPCFVERKTWTELVTRINQIKQGGTPYQPPKQTETEDQPRRLRIRDYASPAGSGFALFMLVHWVGFFAAALVKQYVFGIPLVSGKMDEVPDPTFWVTFWSVAGVALLVGLWFATHLIRKAKTPSSVSQ